MPTLDHALAAIRPPDEDIRRAAIQHLDGLAKPIGSLGRLEGYAAQVAAIRGDLHPTLHRRCVIVMCSDNGVFVEGVASCAQEVTLTQSINFTRGISGINTLCRHAGADVLVVDIGIDSDVRCEGLIDRKIRRGTSNMAVGPAMTREEAIHAIEIGIDMVEEAAAQGYDLIGTGEMGIGNTSTSSAMLMVLTGCSADVAVGKGAGLTNDALAHKKRVIERAIALNRPDPSDPLDVLSKVGGFDIAGMAGCMIGAAFHHVPVLVDGFISSVAALLAVRLCPAVHGYLIPSHKSAEPGYSLAMQAIGLSPALDLGMRLGEGTGCALMFSIVEASLAVLNRMATFEEAAIDRSRYIDIRKDELPRSTTPNASRQEDCE